MSNLKDRGLIACSLSPSKQEIYYEQPGTNIQSSNPSLLVECYINRHFSMSIYNILLRYWLVKTSDNFSLPVSNFDKTYIRFHNHSSSYVEFCVIES